MLAHAAVLGFVKPLSTRIDVAGLAVAGFFGISGFLITRSARRSSLPRYLWHRALRIMPGLWACLLFTALILAPALWYSRYGTLDGLWRHPTGVFNYLQQNWWGGLRQQEIVDTFQSDTPYGRQINRSVVNGSLWTLSYEIFCYLIVAVFALLAILRRARWLVLMFAVAVFGVLVWNHYELLRFGHSMLWTSGFVGPIPLLGGLTKIWFLRYGFMFLVGAVAELYSDRLPINDLLGAAALVVTGWHTLNGELFGPALLAYEYVILWLAVRLPRVLHRVGQGNDYSYGIYIYSFPMQQLMAKLGVQVLGFLGYFLTTALVSTGLAVLSWHLVEKQALRLKGWTPRLRRRRDSDRSGPHRGEEAGQGATESPSVAPAPLTTRAPGASPAMTPASTSG